MLVSCDAQSCADAAAFHAKFERVQKAVREKYPVTLTADAALLLAKMKDADLAPLEAAAEDAGVDPAHYYTTHTLCDAFLAKCDQARMQSFAPLFEGSADAARAALAALAAQYLFAGAGLAHPDHAGSRAFAGGDRT